MSISILYTIINIESTKQHNYPSISISHLRGVDEWHVSRVVQLQLYEHSIDLYSSPTYIRACVSIYLSIYIYTSCSIYFVKLYESLYIYQSIYIKTVDYILHLGGVDEGHIGRVVQPQLYKHSINLYSSLSISLSFSLVLAL